MSVFSSIKSVLCVVIVFAVLMFGVSASYDQVDVGGEVECLACFGGVATKAIGCLNTDCNILGSPMSTQVDSVSLNILKCISCFKGVVGAALSCFSNQCKDIHSDMPAPVPYPDHEDHWGPAPVPDSYPRHENRYDDLQLFFRKSSKN